jgi:DNA-binding NtrC family response regulator
LTGAADAAESVARKLHASSGWRDGPFVVIDCSIGERDVEALLSRWLSRDLTPDELDGPTVRRSQDGIVFFREIGELSSSARAKVAQWVKQVRPCGKPGPRRRVMASSADPVAADTVFDNPLLLDVIHMQVDPSREGDS